jgi:hypothetical protein
MEAQSLIASPGPNAQTVRAPDGRLLTVPAGWVLVPPGDPGLTRRVKAAGPTWTVQEKVGRKLFSRGVWAPAETVERVRAGLAVERADPAYARKQQRAAERRNEQQAVYVEDFRKAVLDYLAFHHRHVDLARRLATAIADHATPVGSGTVARTERIPIEDRAAAATIAWMRHRTTAYDHMTIERVKGRRREVRGMLAERSKRLLSVYRTGDAVDGSACPLAKALGPASSNPAPTTDVIQQ